MKDARLVIEGLGNWVCTHPVGDSKRVTIGRSPENSVMITDLHASSQHAEIVKKEDGYYLRDLGSRNGTFVGEEKVDRVKLEDGSCFKIGATKIHFNLTGDPGFAEQAEESEEQLDRRLALLREGDGETGVGEPASEEELQRELREARSTLRRLRAVAEFGATLAQKRSSLQMLGAAMRFICRHLGGENGFIMQINPETQKWSVRSRYGDILDWSLTGLEEKAPQLPMSLTVVENVIKSGKPVFSLSAIDDPRFSSAKSIESLGIRSCLCAPMMHKGKAVGVVYCDRRVNSAPFSRSEEKLFQALTDQLAHILY